MDKVVCNTAVLGDIYLLDVFVYILLNETLSS